MGSLAWSLARRRTSVWGIAAILAAILTGLTVYSYLSWMRAQIPVAGKLVALVVAARDIAAGEVLSADNLTIAQHPERYLPPSAIRSLADVDGKVSAIPIYKGEAVTSRKLGTKGGLSAVVPAGMRAYSLRIDSGTGLAFLPRPGDRVDVIVTFGREVLGEATSITVLRASEVASIGEAATVGSDNVAPRLGLDASSGIGIGVTLFVTPEEAERLAMAESLGRITLVLAPHDSEGEAAPAPITPQDLGNS